MLEEFHVPVTSLLIVNNYLLITEAVFILLPESAIKRHVRPFMYVYNLKVCGRRLQPPRI